MKFTVSSDKDKIPECRGARLAIGINLRSKARLASISPSSPNPFSHQGRRGTRLSCSPLPWWERGWGWGGFGLSWHGWRLASLPIYRIILKITIEHQSSHRNWCYIALRGTERTSVSPRGNLSYIETHRREVDAEYQSVLQTAQEIKILSWW